MAISLVALNMAVVVLESLLYGAFLILFCAGLYLRISRYTSQSSRNGLCLNAVVISTVAIFLACTGHWIMTVICFVRAFLDYKGPGAALEYYSGDPDAIMNVGSLFTLITLWIGDAVIPGQVHRLWVIWDRSARVVALPVLSWSGLLIVSLAGTPTLFKQSEYNRSAMTAAWVFKALTNVYCTVRDELLKRNY
ncbi:hypothetical protein GGX14DRAFT_609776 [Mycena pura]|uniref:Uncharacterized protein n=1 Tax=Mycena pura TaxID=153505 RepID=A0AAD6VJP8_9AGAR|nr:hypothetical protein GGX14DRAFT_609776 [Mycena pura]